MELPDYFSLFNIPVQFPIDTTQLKKTFYILCRQWHPDKFIGATETEQQHAMAMTSLINKAYTTLQDSSAAVAYWMTLKGIIQPDEQMQLPPDFLMDMMELNESLDDALSSSDTEAVQAIEQNIKNMDEGYEQDMAQYLSDPQSLLADEAKKMALKNIFYKQKYLLRIKERCTTFAPR